MRDRYTVALAYHFHIRPWEIDLLTYSEFMALCDAAEELSKEP